jgi:phage gpG-like protein
MRLYLALKDVQRATLKFERMPKAIMAALLKKGEQLRVRLRRYIIDKKLSGQVLDRKSGKLQKNTRTTLEASNGKIIITASNISRYAMIHEKGGVIPAHIIEPKKALALHWVRGGAQNFAMRVNMPPVVMPKRPYLAPGVKEFSPTMSLELKAAIVEGMKK